MNDLKAAIIAAIKEGFASLKGGESDNRGHDQSPPPGPGARQTQLVPGRVFGATPPATDRVPNQPRLTRNPVI
jgi:hypothetical protein